MKNLLELNRNLGESNHRKAILWLYSSMSTLSNSICCKSNTDLIGIMDETFLNIVSISTLFSIFFVPNFYLNSSATNFLEARSKCFFISPYPIEK
jgi:hypothetical protein